MNKLSEGGYNAALDSGVIIVTVENEKEFKKVHRFVKDIGYNASYGMRIKTE